MRHPGWKGSSSSPSSVVERGRSTSGAVPEAIHHAGHQVVRALRSFGSFLLVVLLADHLERLEGKLFKTSPFLRGDQKILADDAFKSSWFLN
jgi:hypothetical protein